MLCLSSSADFASLLASGELAEKSSLKCTPVDASFEAALMKICFYNHFKGRRGIQGASNKTL